MRYKVIGRKYTDYYTIVTAESRMEAVVAAEGDVDWIVLDDEDPIEPLSVEVIKDEDN